MTWTASGGEHKRLKKILTKMKSADKKKSILTNDWLKLIVTTVGILLGILISLKTATVRGSFEYYVFGVSLASLGFSILLGVITLRGEIAFQKAMAKYYSLAYDKVQVGDSVEPKEFKYEGFYNWTEVLLIFTLILGVVLLVVYGIIK